MTEDRREPEDVDQPAAEDISDVMNAEDESSETDPGDNNAAGRRQQQSSPSADDRQQQHEGLTDCDDGREGVSARK
jgi:hypothetical protein